jgi:hypothetical protein
MFKRVTFRSFHSGAMKWHSVRLAAKRVYTYNSIACVFETLNSSQLTYMHLFTLRAALLLSLHLFPISNQTSS